MVKQELSGEFNHFYLFHRDCGAAMSSRLGQADPTEHKVKNGTTNPNSTLRLTELNL
jgi:hypothetical protein